MSLMTAASPALAEFVAVDGTSQDGYVDGRFTSGEVQQIPIAGDVAVVTSRVIGLASQLQTLQNVEDERWVEKMGLPRHLSEQIVCRLIFRGAAWLEFVEQLVDFKETYRHT